MKIGILTWFFGANYGAQAHSYALYHILMQMGHTCEFIAYYPRPKSRIFIGNASMVIGNRKGLIRHPFRSIKAVAGLNRFKQLHSAYNISQRVYSGQDIDSLGYDLIILGSDEIFKIEHQFFSEVNYGVGIVNTPRITYAPCSGETDVRLSLSKNIQESLKGMIALSARDKYTAELLKNNTGRHVEIVLDPTLLYDFSQVTEALPEKDYVLIYAFSELDEYQPRIREYADAHNQKIISIGRQRRWADKSYELASVSQWLGAFSHASLVITDSFHGTIFAIKNQKEFVRTGFSPNVNKVGSLMEDMQISRGYYHTKESIDQYLKEASIDYNQVCNIIEQKKLNSFSYLHTAIESVSSNSEKKEMLV